MGWWEQRTWRQGPDAKCPPRPRLKAPTAAFHRGTHFALSLENSTLIFFCLAFLSKQSFSKGKKKPPQTWLYQYSVILTL